MLTFYLQTFAAQHTIRKASHLVSSVRKSAIDSETILQATGKRLLPMNATRWNSQLKMLRRLDEVLQKEPNIQNKLNAKTKQTAHDIRILHELFRGGSRILCKGGPEFCVRAHNSGFSLIIHDYITALPLSFWPAGS